MGISAGLGSSALLPAGLGFRNILINGNMVVNQRNTAVTSTGYVVDRWSIESGGGSASKSVAQSTDAPAGYTNSLKATCTTGASGNTLFFSQKVEGYNAAFLGWGASGAKQVTISFWVKSSLTGTYSVALHNPTRARIYVATYSISSANTWEYKTITVQGDSSGTWETTTSTGIQVMFCFGTSSGGYQTSTLNQWFAGDGMSIPIGPSTVPDVMATTNNAFAITGVQLEQNYQATPFEQRPYGTELALCQRYYYRVKSQSAANNRFANGWSYTTTHALCLFPMPVTMRTSPTAFEQSGTASDYSVFSGAGSGVACSAVPANDYTTPYVQTVDFTVASGLTVGQGTICFANGTANAYFGWSAEL